MAKGVSLKEHFDALAAQRVRYEGIIHVLEQRHADQAAAWIKEKFESHNNLLQAWRSASDADRATFVKLAAFDALSDKFNLNTETTAHALTLAEGKSRGYLSVAQVLTFVGGLIVTGISVGAAIFAALHR